MKWEIHELGGNELGGDTIYVFTHILDNLCKNALDLSNDKLIIDNNWQFGTYCEWLISAMDDKHYVILEFENIDVKIAQLDYLPNFILLYTWYIFLFRSQTGLIDLIFLMDLMNTSQ